MVTWHGDCGSGVWNILKNGDKIFRSCGYEIEIAKYW